MKMVLAAVAASLGLSGAAMAQEGTGEGEYVLAGVSDTAIMFYNLETEKTVRSGVKTAWLYTIAKDTDYNHAKELIEYRCSADEYMTQYIVIYGNDGSVTSSKKYTVDYVIPDSVFESVFDIACNDSAKRYRERISGDDIKSMRDDLLATLKG